jgi:hypothetical protein
VILSEYHDAARIDRQLFGRAGRQGDPGSCEAIVSLDDELFLAHASPLLGWLRARAAPMGCCRRTSDACCGNSRKRRQSGRIRGFAGRRWKWTSGWSNPWRLPGEGK